MLLARVISPWYEEAESGSCSTYNLKWMGKQWKQIQQIQTPKNFSEMNLLETITTWYAWGNQKGKENDHKAHSNVTVKDILSEWCLEKHRFMSWIISHAMFIKPSYFLQNFPPILQPCGILLHSQDFWILYFWELWLHCFSNVSDQVKYFAIIPVQLTGVNPRFKQFFQTDCFDMVTRSLNAFHYWVSNEG